MPTLDARFFAGGGDIPADIAEKLTVRNASDRDRDILTKLGWEGQLIGFVGIVLSTDGKSVTGARFGLQGKLAEQPIAVQAAKLWAEAERDISLVIDLPEAATFKFTSGTLCSDFLAKEEVKYKVMKGAVRVNKQEEDSVGCTGFCLRVIAHLDKSSNTRNGPGPHLKVSVLVFPENVAELEERSDKACEPGWPGIKMVESKAELFPKVQRGTWGAPMFPLLIAAGRASTSAAIPEGDKLRFALASLMRTAVVPTACASRRSLTTKCQEICSGAAMAAGKQPSISWPAATTPAIDRGKIAFKILTRSTMSRRCFNISFSDA
jgi:hypothetical protein